MKLMVVNVKNYFTYNVCKEDKGSKDPGITHVI